jgi:hypothetical protein
MLPKQAILLKQAMLLRRVAGSGVNAGAQPGGAALEGTTLLLAQATPDPGILAAVDRPPEAILNHRATPAHLLGFLNLQQRGPAVPNGEEQLRIDFTTGGYVAPVHDSTPSWRCGPWYAPPNATRACEVFHELGDMPGNALLFPIL